MRMEELEDARRRIMQRMEAPQTEESRLQLIQELSAIEEELLLAVRHDVVRPIDVEIIDLLPGHELIDVDRAGRFYVDRSWRAGPLRSSG
jgi:hypothetical protein